MALIVKLFINEREIESYSAVRKRGQPHELCLYELRDGAMIDHHYDDGAEALAVKILLNTLTRKVSP